MLSWWRLSVDCSWQQFFFMSINKMATRMLVEAQVLPVPASIDGVLVDLCVVIGVADSDRAR